MKTILVLISFFSVISINIAEIHEAVKKGDLGKVLFLIQNDKGLTNLKDENGNTPLHWAALSRNSEIVKLLLENGADPSPMNNKGDTPINYAIGRLPEEMVDLMLDYGAEFDASEGKALNVLQLSARFRLERLFKIISEKGGPILFSDSSANIETLKSAILGGSIELVKILVEKGVDINSVSKYRGTPLDIAYETENQEIIEYLNSKDARFTPLDFETNKLSESLLLITFPWGMRNNMIAFGGKDGLLIIDAGFSKRAVVAIKTTITSFDEGEIRYVVNSHSHWDHVAGNNGLVSTNDAIIGLRKIEDGSLNHIITRLDNPMTGGSGLALPSQYMMKFNEQEIFFFPYSGLHSADDMLIYFPESNVLYLGDLLLSQSCPAIENVMDYMEFLNTILDIFPANCTFIGGHGEDLTYSGLKKYRNDISAMNEIVKKEFQSGKSVEQILAENVLSDYIADYSHLDWLGPEMWIRNVYENLEQGNF